MTFTAVFLESAEQDLKELRSHIIRKFGNTTWQASYRKIKDSVNILKTFPLEGCVPEEFERLGLTQFRQVISGICTNDIYGSRHKNDRYFTGVFKSCAFDCADRYAAAYRSLQEQTP